MIDELLGVKRIVFRNRQIDVVGHLHLPIDFDEAVQYPAIVLATPGSSVKEQVGAIYGGRLAASGFLALTFDPSHQGESGGEPRDLEDPAVRVEDIRCAVDWLTTLPFVDNGRIGLLGICAGGGYAVSAAQTEHRFKVVGTVVGTDIGRAFRGMQGEADLANILETLGAQRTGEARGDDPRRDPWIPDSLADANAAGVTDEEVLEAVTFYRESRYRHPNSNNRLLFRSYAQILGFDALSLVPDLLTLPLQVIVGGRHGNTRQYEAGELLFELSPSVDKDFFVVEGAGHYDLYHRPQFVDQAVDRLVNFYKRHLGA